MRSALLFVLFCAPIAAQAPQSVVPERDHPGIWNQWRGPDRTGQYPGAAWPESLDSLQPAWRMRLGKSYSGPVVDERAVYTTETVDQEFEVVRALDRDTGEELWSTKWKGAMKVPFFAAKNGSWIRATPTLDGDSLYVAGMRDVLVCLNTADGAVRWKVDFVERNGSPLPSFGFVSSPLVRDNALYTQAGAAFVKLDKRTGETVWQALGDQGGMNGSAFSSPVFATLAGREQLVVQGRLALHGVSDEGEVLWSHPIKTFRGMNILTPLPYGGGIFTSAYGGRGHFFEPAGDDSLEMVEKWENRTQAYMTSPVVVDGHAYVFLRSQRFSCVELATGEVCWTTAPTGDTYWSLIAQNDRILALTDNGELHLIAANPEKFDVKGTAEVADTPTWAHLAVDGSQVFVRALDELIAFDWE